MTRLTEATRPLPRPAQAEAAAVITYLSLGLRFFQKGQFQGRTKHVSPHLCREPNEPVNRELEPFYDELLAVLRSPVVRDGSWQLLECRADWTWDDFVAFACEGPGGERLLVAVNYADNQGPCATSGSPSRALAAGPGDCGTSSARRTIFTRATAWRDKVCTWI